MGCILKNDNYDIKFIHPVKFHGDESKTNREKLENEIIPYSIVHKMLENAVKGISRFFTSGSI